MDSEVEILEERLKSFLSHLQAEYGILDRLVYKNKNQHRRCSYFQHLSKVRRDLRLLESAHLEEILGSCFQVINGMKPKQKVHLLESLKKRKCDGGKYNFMERLLGVARLLSQMVEPMLKAATEISTLLARSFFMGFSLTILALLARLRVLVQQILLDVISVFNIVSSLSQKKQSVKIFQEGIEVYREYYPTNEEVVTLECLWETDKFVLLERMHKNEIKNQDGDHGGDVPLGSSAVHYQSIDAFLGVDELGSRETDAEHTAKEGPSCVTEDTTDMVAGLSVESDDCKIEGCRNVGDCSGIAGSPSKNFPPEGGLVASSKSSESPNPLNLKSGSRGKVAFVSVKRPAPSNTNVTDFHFRKIEDESDDKKDPFFSLLTGGNLKDSLF
ncbi:hypothetical protein L1049_001313 [Liquidambar formosana]|uniref:Nucleolus and neural progenitor protein-like N-terminal domain-containing protein n=1 Tax=Liquidambar formosana TaxID=63359 RepID=A0AAP0NAD8_LIQFO